MKNVIFITIFSVLISFIAAAPTCLMEGDCKVKTPFYQVNCMEKLKFKHPKANCFINENDEFLIFALNEDNLMKNTIADYQTNLGSEADNVQIHRLKRSVTAEDETNINAEVLSDNYLKTLLNKQQKDVTESPNVVNTNSLDKSNEGEGKVGVIVIISLGDENNEVDGAGDNSVGANGGEEELAEALFGLLLIGAILEEVKKHQIETADESESKEGY